MAYTCLSPSLAKTVQILLWPCTKRLQCSLFVEVFIWLVQLPPPAALGSLQQASVCAVLMAVKPLLMSYTTRIPRDACFYTKITFFFFYCRMRAHVDRQSCVKAGRHTETSPDPHHAVCGCVEYQCPAGPSHCAHALVCVCVCPFACVSNCC